jgi:hypothetical protein
VYNRGLPGGTSNEWPSVTPSHFISPELQHRPAATDRLHLDVGYKWPTQFNQPFIPSNHQIRNPPVDPGCNQMLPSLAVPLSFDWPPSFRGYSKLSHDAALSYDQLYNPQLQSSARSGIPTQLMQRGGICSDKDRKYLGDSDVGEDAESYWFSEEESDARAHSGRDINQCIGVLQNTQELVFLGPRLLVQMIVLGLGMRQMLFGLLMTCLMELHQH